MEDRATLSKITYEFFQDGNTDGTTEQTEELVVEVEGAVGSIEKFGGYLVIRTRTGWSVNNPKEFEELLNIVKNGVSSENLNNDEIK